MEHNLWMLLKKKEPYIMWNMDGVVYKTYGGCRG